MNKCVFAVILSCATFAAFSGSASHLATAEEVLGKNYKPGSGLRAYWKRYGGDVRKANSASGLFVVLNSQKRFSRADFEPALVRIDKDIHPKYAVKDVESVKLANPKADIRAAGGNVGVVLADVPELPALVCGPEDGWAIVNVAALAEGSTNNVQVAARLRKELMRAFALAGGCAFMSRTAIVMSPDVRRPSDLDSLSSEEYGVEAINALNYLLPSFGITPWKQTSYRAACEQGWAPEPVNVFQKKIWDEFHAQPTQPMQIKYDSKKGE